MRSAFFRFFRVHFSAIFFNFFSLSSSRILRCFLEAEKSFFKKKLDRMPSGHIIGECGKNERDLPVEEDLTLSERDFGLLFFTVGNGA